ncbi:MAG: DUF1801 domain-containing protein [Rhodococcus sp. (in: high G+C Gram-positive bacteria)]|uniref:DUF1801 domain-containing protein n=1 Tax=Rhodococcus sp. TaxID=1831 RepID=UPI0011F62890|nr:DUF1801 domain-containing protein [Rhodococcus sp. (in: high G+C Gram-positive bacteria)]RZL24235.1 MAG: DUF1801 domain-containing protein [Rhodococcus sp. (in: high G+C Gram-positive bacteria)]
MATANKTQPTPDDVGAFVDRIADPVKRADSAELISVLSAASGEPPVMWGTSIIGFGARHYRYASGHEGDTALIGFSPRATALTLYLSLDFDEHASTLGRLGKHKIGKGCLYVKRLSDIDRSVLEELVTESVAAALNMNS